MKRISRVTLSVAVFLCFASRVTFSQTIPNWAPNTAYAVGALVIDFFEPIEPHTAAGSGADAELQHKDLRRQLMFLLQVPQQRPKIRDAIRNTIRMIRTP